MVDQAASRKVGDVAVEEGRGGSGWLAASLLLLGLLLLLVVRRLEPTAPLGLGAPPAEFSAARAMQVLRRLLGDGQPHPIGSPANAAVRERILASLRDLGLSPRIEEGFSCVPFQGCARVSNVVARLDGRRAGKAVLLTAHYDSVPAGPGASDDLANVAAVLEVARGLKAGPPPRNPVLLLLDDGEEAGLLGAKVFESQAPEYHEVGAVVNLEARGTAGPSLMFETSGNSGWLIPLFARSAAHPITSSVFATIYSVLPNNTDLTIYKGDRLPGLNFAFIEKPAHYHTLLDNLDNVALASLQHQGDNALGVVRALAEADLGPRPASEAVYFDLLGASVVHWQQTGAVRLAEIILLVLALALAPLLVARRVLPGRSLGLGLVLVPAALVSALLLGIVLRLLLGGALSAPWLARPAPALVTFWAAGLAVATALAAWLCRAGSRGLWLATWSWWAWLGLALSALAPGIGYLFLVPALVAAVFAWPALRAASSPAARALAALVPALVASLLWFPLLIPLYVGLGTGGLAVIAMLVALLATTLAPLLALAGRPLRRALPAVAAAAMVVAAVMAAAAPPYSTTSPLPLNLELHQDAGSGQARWLVRAMPLPPELRRAAGFGQRQVPPDPWSSPSSLAFVAPAPSLAVPAPELTVLASEVTADSRHLRLRLTSPRGARIGLVLLPAAAQVRSVTIDGKSALPPDWKSAPGATWLPFVDLTLPAAGCELDVVLGEKKPLDWYVADRSPGLPAGGEALLRARPATAAPAQGGDSTLVSRKVTI